MKSKWSILALAPLAALAMALGACGDDGNGNGGTPGAGDSSPSAVPRPTMFPAPVITGNTIASEVGYTATFPEGWRVRPSFIQPKDAVVDAFFEPVERTPQVSIAVTCVLDTSTQPAEYLEAQKAVTRRLNENVQESARQVAGVQATVLSYIQEQKSQPAEPKLDKQDVIFSTSKCHWTISTVTPENERPQYQPLFDAFVDSFRTTGS